MPHQPYKRIVAGADTAILFVHGIVGTPDQFLPLMPLVPEDWSCVNLLLPGHGGSVSDFSHSSMEEWRRFVSREVNMLAQTHHRILLVGHSMGTLFCIDEAMYRHEAVQGLFLLACPLYPQLTPSAAKQSLQVAFGLQGRSDAARAAHHACSVRATWKLWEYIGWIPRYLELFAAARQGRQQIGSVTTPTIAVQSAKDELVARRSGQLLQAAPAVTLHVLPTGRHFYWPPQDLALLQEHFQNFITTQT